MRWRSPDWHWSGCSAPGAAASAFSYDSQGNPVRTTDALGGTTKANYSITVDPALQITTPTLTSYVTVNVPGYKQTVATTGGTAPAQGCDEAHSGAENRVPYTATYLFLK